MLYEDNANKPNRPAKKRRRLPPPLTAEELHFLKTKRYINEWDVIRFFQISESTFYNWIRDAYLEPSWMGGKKFFDLEDIFKRLDERKGKGRG